MRLRTLLVSFLFILPLAVYSGGMPEPPGSNAAPLTFSADSTAPQAAPQGQPQGTPQTEPSRASRGEAVFRAFASAYPDRIGAVEFFDGDWTIEVYGERFYFAEGRILPASLRHSMNDYDGIAFYNYPASLPPWTAFTPEESARMRDLSSLRASRTLRRSPHFFDALWRTRNREEAWENVKQIRFLGQSVMVHYSILTQISLVEQQIIRSSRTSAAVRQWIANLATVDGWSWRDIALTESRSFHAYGAAVDILPVPAALRGFETYWVWTSRHSSEWWNIPYSRRYHPPDEIIKAFESFGFIWGGKWRFFDTMHFEYRPEVLFMSGLPPMDLRELR